MSFKSKQIILIILITLLFTDYSFSQNCQVILISGKSYTDLHLDDLSVDTLIFNQQNGKEMKIPVGDVKEIYLETKGNVKYRIKKMLIGSLMGGAIGCTAGLLFSDFALRWLSNKDNPKGWISNPNISEGDKVIISLCTGMSSLIGTLHGFDWAVEKSINTRRYDLSKMTLEEKAETIDEIVKLQK